MTYRLRYDHRLVRQLEALPGDIWCVAQRLIQSLTDVPIPFKARELELHPGYYRVWLPRNHRLAYVLLDDEQIVDLLYVGPEIPDVCDNRDHRRLTT